MECPKCGSKDIEICWVGVGKYKGKFRCQCNSCSKEFETQPSLEEVTESKETDSK